MKLPYLKDYLILIILLVFRANPSAALQKRDSLYRYRSTTTRTTPRHPSVNSDIVLDLRGGGWLFLPAGWNPFGYKVTALGEAFLKYEGSTDGDVGRFLASVKERKTKAALKQNWIEVVRVAKTAKAMRIWRQLDDLISFCLRAGFLD